MEHQSMSLLELNALVKKSIHLCLPDEYWIQAELSDVRTNYSGHCYLEFVQKDARSNALVAKARGMIWNHVFAQIKPYFEQNTGQAFTSGIKVLVKVTVDFHELYGYSLTVTDIDPTYTLGDMARKRKEILQQLEAEGVLTLNKELKLPELTQRIAVISSATAAGFGDFCNQLRHNTDGFVFYPKLFPAVMQGEKVESSIISALNHIYKDIDSWDVVVIIRGGGATSDLSGFDTYELAANCVQFPLPIITGIGHERDDTVIDMVSHTRVKTPTAAAEFLISHTRQTADRLKQYAAFLNQEVPLAINRQREKLNRWVMRMPAKVQMRLQHERFYQKSLSQRISSAWSTRFLQEQYRLQITSKISASYTAQIQREGHRLELFAQQIKSASPERLLKKGYSITLKNGKAVTNADELKHGDELVTLVANGKFRSKVLK